MVACASRGRPVAPLRKRGEAALHLDAHPSQAAGTDLPRGPYAAWVRRSEGHHAIEQAHRLLMPSTQCFDGNRDQLAAGRPGIGVVLDMLRPGRGRGDGEGSLARANVGGSRGVAHHDVAKERLELVGEPDVGVLPVLAVAEEESFLD